MVSATGGQMWRLIHAREMGSWVEEIDPGLSQLEAKRLLRKRKHDMTSVAGEPSGRYVREEDLADDGTVEDVATPIPVAHAVAGTATIDIVLERLRAHEAVFVLIGGSVAKIITRADIGSDEVSTAVLSEILRLERLLDEAIEHWYQDEWSGALSPERFGKVREIYELRQRHNAEISLIRALNLDDRFTLAAKNEGIRRVFGLSRNKLEDEFKQIKKARNNLAHGTDLLEYLGDPTAALDVIGLITERTGQLSAFMDDLDEPHQL